MPRLRPKNSKLPDLALFAARFKNFIKKEELFFLAFGNKTKLPPKSEAIKTKRAKISNTKTKFKIPLKSDMLEITKLMCSAILAQPAILPLNIGQEMAPL